MRGDERGGDERRGDKRSCVWGEGQGRLRPPTMHEEGRLLRGQASDLNPTSWRLQRSFNMML